MLWKKYISQTLRSHGIIVVYLFVYVFIMLFNYLSIWICFTFFIALEKSWYQFILTNKLKTDYPCDLQLWLMYFSPSLVIYSRNSIGKKVNIISSYIGDTILNEFFSSSSYLISMIMELSELKCIVDTFQAVPTPIMNSMIVFNSPIIDMCELVISFSAICICVCVFYHPNKVLLVCVCV